MLSSVLFALAASTSVMASKWSSEADILQFDNVGYTGYYYPVGIIQAISDGTCNCAKDYDNPVTFSGAIAPLNEELTVHFRGPINLLKFGFYTTDSYSSGSTDGSWTREAYYDAESGTANNVTFLGNYGNSNECLGNASDYLSSNGLELADSSEILDNVNISSALEFTIASGVECADETDCGAYREDGQAYHGFGGVNKMFLFEFRAPSDTSEEGETNHTDGYDMPAIWLLNAATVRTSQYPTNANCTAWNSGSGEFDIFEVMNYTERNHFYSTIHDFQGTDDIGTGLQNFGYLERTPDSIMLGGVVFGDDGVITVFLSNSTSLDETIDNSDLNDWISTLEDETEKVETLESITNSPPSSHPSALISSVATIVGSSSSSTNAAAHGNPQVGRTTFLSTFAALLGIFYI